MLLLSIAGKFTQRSYMHLHTPMLSHNKLCSILSWWHFSPLRSTLESYVCRGHRSYAVSIMQGCALREICINNGKIMVCVHLFYLVVKPQNNIELMYSVASFVLMYSVIWSHTNTYIFVDAVIGLRITRHCDLITQDLVEKGKQSSPRESQLWFWLISIVFVGESQQILAHRETRDHSWYCQM